MSDGNGGYYSAFDADSEGEEGKYYVWTQEELKKIKFPPCGIVDGYTVFSEYYNVNKIGYWEKNNYILLRKKTDEEIASLFNISKDDLKKFINLSKKILLKVRRERIPPALDKKIITSWNALQISALCVAYQSFGIEKYKTEAKICAEGILKNALSEDGMLLHVRSQKNILKTGFLEDYAFTISAFINLYQVTFEERWLIHAKKFADDAIKNYYDDVDGFFWFTSKSEPVLVARKKESTDNVIPSSNSEMANALFLLGDYFDDKNFSDIARQMLASVEPAIINYPSSFSNWAYLMMNYTKPFNEVVITGENADEYRKQLSSYYLPNALFAGSNKKTEALSLLKDRFKDGKSLIYICTNKTCKLPVDSPFEALTLLKKE